MTDVITGHVIHPAGGPLTSRPFGPDDLPGMLSMLARCSNRTLVRRFHGATDGAFHLHELARRSDHLTLGAWNGSACVGLGTLVTEDPSHDLGVLVEDAWQGRGVGTSLLTRLVGLANAAGIDELHADVVAESAWVLRTLSRIGRVHAELDCGVYSVRLELASTDFHRAPAPGAEPKRAMPKMTMLEKGGGGGQSPVP